MRRAGEGVGKKGGVEGGVVLVNAMHMTASVFTNDDERGLHNDFKRFLEQLAPYEPTSQWRHNDTGEDNAHAHLKRQLFGRAPVVAITAAKLLLRPRRQTFYPPLLRETLHPAPLLSIPGVRAHLAAPPHLPAPL